MDKSKIKLFEKENPSKKFPAFRSIGSEEQEVICRKISEKLGIGLQKDLFAIAETITKKGVLLKQVNAQDENFKLFQLLENQKIRPEKKIFVNWWFKSGDMDEFTFSDINEYLSDIWLPGPDDIDIFDSTFNWIIHIDHSGYISIIR